MIHEWHDVPVEGRDPVRVGQKRERWIVDVVSGWDDMPYSARTVELQRIRGRWESGVEGDVFAHVGGTPGEAIMNALGVSLEEPWMRAVADFIARRAR